jgi:hypothetical protein
MALMGLGLAVLSSRAGVVLVRPSSRAGEPDHALVRPWPMGHDASDGSACGEVIARLIAEAGWNVRTMTAVLARSELTLRWIDVPEAVNDPDERATMIRLSLSRGLGVPAQGLAVDALEEPSPESGARSSIAHEAATPDSRSVLTGAITQSRLEWWNQVAQAASLKLEHVWSRAEGWAALAWGAICRAGGARESGAIEAEGAWLVLAPGLGQVELVIVKGQAMHAARTVDLEDADSASAIDRVTQEAKRLVASVQLELAGIIGLGESMPMRAMRRSIAVAFEKPEWTLDSASVALRRGEGPSAEPREEAASWEVGVAAAAKFAARPLGARLDLVATRRRPDRHARQRQLALAGVLAVILVGGVGVLLAQRHLGDLRAEIDGATEKRAALASTYESMLLSEARSKHLQQWVESAKFGWLPHLRWLSEEMPHPSRAVLDEFRGTLSAPVSFMSKDGEYRSGVWSVSPRATFTVSGWAQDREIANDLRSRLVASQVYGVESQGADVEDRFVFELKTGMPTPRRLQGPSPVPSANAPKPGGARGASSGSAGGAR